MMIARVERGRRSTYAAKLLAAVNLTAPIASFFQRLELDGMVRICPSWNLIVVALAAYFD